MGAFQVSFLSPNQGVEYLRLSPLDANSAREVIFFHGFTQSGWSWMRIATQLTQPMGLILNLLNLPGHQGNRETMAPEEFFEALARTFPSADLVGYSMGGRLALWYSSLYPNQVKSLLLMSTHVGRQSDQDRAARHSSDDLIADELVRADRTAYQQFLSRWNAQPIFSGRVLSTTELAIRQDHVPQRLGESLRLYSTAQQPDLTDHIATFDKPISYLAGELDHKYVGFARTLDQLHGPHVQTIQVRQSGHDIPNAAPETVIDLLREHLLRSETN